jgi:D-erythro-7,8-dihydroneopterin triphosphate epimerase
MAIIRIKNLSVQTFIGFNPEELINKQEVIINLEIEANLLAEAIEKDEPEGIYDYKKLTKQVISFVEGARTKLLEVLTKKILDLILEDSRVNWAKVEVDKPGALRFADSVSVVMEAKRKSG